MICLEESEVLVRCGETACPNHEKLVCSKCAEAEITNCVYCDAMVCRECAEEFWSRDPELVEGDLRYDEHDCCPECTERETHRIHIMSCKYCTRERNNKSRRA